MSDLEPHDEHDAVQKILTGGKPTYLYSVAYTVVGAILMQVLVWIDAMQAAIVGGILMICFMLCFIHTELCRIKNRRIRIWEARQRYGEE